MNNDILLIRQKEFFKEFLEIVCREAVDGGWYEKDWK